MSSQCLIIAFSMYLAFVFNGIYPTYGLSCCCRFDYQSDIQIYLSCHLCHLWIGEDLFGRHYHLEASSQRATVLLLFFQFCFPMFTLRYQATHLCSYGKVLATRRTNFWILIDNQSYWVQLRGTDCFDSNEMDCFLGGSLTFFVWSHRQCWTKLVDDHCRPLLDLY